MTQSRAAGSPSLWLVPYSRQGKRTKIRFVPVHVGAQRMIFRRERWMSSP